MKVAVRARAASRVDPRVVSPEASPSFGASTFPTAHRAAGVRFDNSSASAITLLARAPINPAASVFDKSSLFDKC
ncbi:MAG: hypothetical protein M3444_13020 [Acidobacteriota bacterium]|nr:hypothetical protein [Acidobacteriota bacterium]